ncbi:hypothetical protein H5410_003767 [Solanum commersonii]|uniref:Uncharacterized protein n=1 Tax=Solanum commersonii TaxID=4109 RepID=A0A9J6B615_SOLCO|nr:hypothetical protein H5410_003767 [Solanum commersonii]
MEYLPPEVNKIKSFALPWRLFHQYPSCKERRRSLYADTLQPMVSIRAPVPIKPLTYLHGEPRVTWNEEEISQMIVNEDLE